MAGSLSRLDIGSRPESASETILTRPGTPMITDVTVQGPPTVATDPGWSLVWEGFDLLRERDLESSMTVGNGYLGTRGALEEGSKASSPGTLIAGVYGALPETGDIPELEVAPNWLLFTV